MHPPDWGRIDVNSRASDTLGRNNTPAGDPTRWGSDGSVDLPLALGTFYTQQLIRADALTQYGRNWQIIGNIAATKQFWNVSSANLSLGLEVAMGVGQATLVQVFDLRALTDLAAPWYVVQPAVTDLGFIIKPWCIAGGLVGHSLAARVVVQAVDAIILEDAQTLRATAVTSPFAAGAGI